MREIKSKKNNLFKKFFIKVCRFFGVELIDQSNFSIPTSLDLLMISDQSNPPVCKIVDFGQFRYHQQK